MKKTFKQNLKQYIPPILLNKLQYIKAKQKFSKYKNLVSKNIELKDKHKGKRCFILGSGPSIKKEDLKLLKNEIVFALNNFYVHEDFAEIMSGDKDKYYMTAPIHPPQTEEEWKEWFSDMEKHIPKTTTMLLGLNNYKGNIKYIFDKYGLFKKHQIYWYYAGRQFDKDNFNSKFLDITNIIYTAEAVSLYALVASMYMGFEKIYLLGMDHNYFLFDNEKNMRMYKNAIHQNNELKRTFGNDFYVIEFLRQYNIFIKYRFFTKNFQGSVYNLSEESLLKIFPKVKLREVIEKCI